MIRERKNALLWTSLELEYWSPETLEFVVILVESEDTTQVLKILATI